MPALALSILASPALAGLEFCNATGQEQSVAIGHLVEGVWTSEGWWNIEDGDCSSPIEDALLNRYYYYRAEVPDGVFPDDGYKFCVDDRAFTIEGQDGCKARGYELAGFKLIDTGDTATHFTLTLVPPSGARSDGPGKSGDSGESDLVEKPGAPEREDARLTRRGIIGPETLESGYLPGTSGEPFDQIAIFQTCDSFSGLAYCSFIANGTKWYAYKGGATPDPFLDRIADLPVGTGVEITGDIVGRDEIGIDIALSTLTVRASALEHQIEFDAIQGAWVRDQGTAHTLRFEGAEIIEDAPGAPEDLFFWRFADGCEDAPANMDFVLVKSSPGRSEEVCYLPLTITHDKLELTHLTSGETLSFKRP
ncbi:MAG: DUF1036 domain-containing protein [Pseudomonadota bacterium]